MHLNVPKVPEKSEIDPAIANKITQIINNVSNQIIEETPPDEMEEDDLKSEIKEAVMKEVEPMLEENELLIKAAEKLVDNEIDKAWEGIKEKLKEPKAIEEISPIDVNFCGKCGNKIEKSWTVCQNCGVELDLSLYQESGTSQQTEVSQQTYLPQKSIEAPITPPVSKPLTQDKEEVYGPYNLCEDYNPLPSGGSCEHYDERTYDCSYYGVEYCPLNKQIAKFRAKKKYLISIMKNKVERRAFKPNEYYDGIYEREFMKK